MPNAAGVLLSAKCLAFEHRVTLACNGCARRKQPLRLLGIDIVGAAGAAATALPRIAVLGLLS